MELLHVVQSSLYFALEGNYRIAEKVCVACVRWWFGMLVLFFFWSFQETQKNLVNKGFLVKCFFELILKKPGEVGCPIWADLFNSVLDRCIGLEDVRNYKYILSSIPNKSSWENTSYFKKLFLCKHKYWDISYESNLAQQMYWSSYNKQKYVFIFLKFTREFTMNGKNGWLWYYNIGI